MPIIIKIRNISITPKSFFAALCDPSLSLCTFETIDLLSNL